MRIPVLLILLSSICTLPATAPRAAAPSAKPTLRALLIAVGDYPRTGGWGKLSSVQDAEILEEALRAQQFEDIVVLTDKDATKAGIEAAFADLTDRVAAGDIVYLHFSGHGQQVWDHESEAFPQRKKEETDGFDEALVPYDARDEFRPGIYEGENHLVDDELSIMLTDLRRKIGPQGQLIFTVDACYSGSISRSGGLLPVRGTTKRLAPASANTGRSGASGSSAFSEAFGVTNVNLLSDLIVISAARADQPNYETVDAAGRGVGSLSYALSRQLLQPFSSVPSYAGFFRRVEAEMARVAPYQSPQLEGEADKALFGDQLIPMEGYPLLAFSDERHATVRGGQLAGLHPETPVRLIPATGLEKKEELAGRVVSSTLSEAVIELEEALVDANPADWLMITQAGMLVFSPVQIAVEVEDASVLEAILAEADRSERLSVVEEHAQLLVRQTGAVGELELSDMAGAPLGSYPLSGGADAAVKALFQRIQQYTRAHYFRNLDNTGSAAEAALTIMPIPVTTKLQDNKYIISALQEEKLLPDRVVQPMPIGTSFIFRVTNRKPTPLYVNIVGVDAADEVFLLLPDNRTPPAEFVVAPDSTVYFARPEFIFQIAEPAGKQLFMALASPEPVDLRPVFRQAETGQQAAFRSSASPQGKVLGELLFGNRRSGGLPGAAFTISSVVVEIPEQQ